jgi:hypothetical protein
LMLFVISRIRWRFDLPEAAQKTRLAVNIIIKSIRWRRRPAAQNVDVVLWNKSWWMPSLFSTVNHQQSKIDWLAGWPSMCVSYLFSVSLISWQELMMELHSISFAVASDCVFCKMLLDILNMSSFWFLLFFSVLLGIFYR